MTGPSCARHGGIPLRVGKRQPAQLSNQPTHHPAILQPANTKGCRPEFHRKKNAWSGLVNFLLTTIRISVGYRLSSASIPRLFIVGENKVRFDGDQACASPRGDRLTGNPPQIVQRKRSCSLLQPIVHTLAADLHRILESTTNGTVSFPPASVLDGFRIRQPRQYQ